MAWFDYAIIKTTYVLTADGMFSSVAFILEASWRREFYESSHEIFEVSSNYFIHWERALWELRAPEIIFSFLFLSFNFYFCLSTIFHIVGKKSKHKILLCKNFWIQRTFLVHDLCLLHCNNLTTRLLYGMIKVRDPNFQPFPTQNPALDFYPLKSHQ